MKNKILQYLLLSFSVVTLFSACRKDPFKTTETKESGKTFVWITEADASANLQYFDPFTDVKTVVFFTVRRDPANKADLQKAVTVILKANADSTNHDGLTPITPDVASLPTAADIASGGVFAGTEGITANSDFSQLTVNFAPGEFAKNIIFKVDGSKLDLSNTYGNVYDITNFGGFTGKVGFSTIAAGVAVKNKWDGNYDVTGSYTDANIPAASGKYPYNVNLETSGPTSDQVYNVTYGGYEFAFNVGDGTSSAYGSFAPAFTFDPATNKITDVTNVYGQGSGSHKRSAKLDPTGDNIYDPSTKSFKVKYIMVSDGADRCHFDETYTYKGSR